MSKYKTYAARVNDLAKENFAVFLKAKAEFEAAERHYKDNQRPRGIWNADAEKIARVAHAEADYAEKKAVYEAARKKFEGSLNDLRGIRSELEKAIDADNMANPDDLDSNTLELLKSGILKPSEYGSLLEKFGGNATMSRMIGSYAEARSKEDGRSVEDRAALNYVARNARQANGGDRLEAFDALSDVYRRCTRNPAMIGYWDELTSETVENF